MKDKAGKKLPYEKPQLKKLGHMAQVTQKSGPDADAFGRTQMGMGMGMGVGMGRGRGRMM